MTTLDARANGAPPHHAPSNHPTGAPADAPLTDHEYDGIQEYDNPTPGWWFLIFFLTCLWSVGYWIIWEMDPDAPSNAKLWERDVAAVNQAMFSRLGALSPDEPTILSLMGNPDWMPVAEGIFRSSCVSCHGRDAGGIQGPNLTDDAYKNIKVITDIPRIIRDGAAGGAMPAQRALSQNEIVLISSYVAWLRGRNVAGRAPEGDVIPPWPKPPAAPASPAAPAK